MNKYFFIAILMSFIWGSNFPISQIGITSIGSSLFRFFCLLTSIIFLFLLFFKQIINNVLGLSLDDYKKLFVLSVPNIFIVPLLNNIALSQTNISSATLLLYIMPCLSSILTMIIDRKINFISIIASIICTLGLLFFIKSSTFDKGEYIILISAFFWALGAILAQKNSLNHIPMGLSIFIQMCFSLLLVSVYLAIEFFYYSININNLTFNSDVFLCVIYIGVVGSSLVYYLWFYLIKEKNAEYTCYSTLVSPLISIAIAILFFQETLTQNQILGGALILLSSFLITLIKPIFDSIKNKSIK